VIILTGFAGLFLFFNKNVKQGSVCVNNFCFQVKIAKTPQELVNGLMFRKSLEQNKGMLFIFEKEDNYPFWMKNTLIPLDIIWINSNSKVVFISESQPCPPAQTGQSSICPSINPFADAKYVLEINAGLSKKIGLKLGDTVIIK